ncbi:flagellar motor protein MotB [Endozoicomonadaceae bacterium StTr2]
MKDSTIIIKRKRSGKSNAHHGGSWKVAFADFTLAMMALFLVLWLIEASSPAQRKAIARYFADPGVFEENASNQAIEMDGPLIPEMRDAELPELPNKPYGPGPTGVYYVDPEIGNILAAWQKSPNKEPHPKKIENLKLEQLPSGVRIELSDSDGRNMFGKKAGSSTLEPYFEDFLLSLAPYIQKSKRAVIIRGHADARPFRSQNGRDNWDLSSERAQAARRTLVFGGVSEDRILSVAGMGDNNLLDKEDPYSPINRRIEIVLLNDKSAEMLKGMLGEGAENKDVIDLSEVANSREFAESNQL